jgi:class 3 adenylate cyclase
MRDSRATPLDTAALLREHPWPAELVGPRPLEWLWSIDVAMADHDLWALVSDVSRLNRALGNPEMDFIERDGVRWGSGRYGGIFHEWREVPWQWVAGQWFTFARVYRRGAMRSLYSVHRLERLTAVRTRLHVYFGVVPRWRALSPAMRWSFAALGRAYRRVVPHLAPLPKEPVLPGLLLTPATLQPGAGARLDAIVASLRQRPVDAVIVDRLHELVRDGDDLDVCRMQVRALARAWGSDVAVVLPNFLHATRAGLLELVWDVVCPHCRGVRTSTTALDQLPSNGNCDVCQVEFGTSDAVEVTFRAHPSLRSVTPRTYCSAEPATKTHIRVQRTLAAGTQAEVAIEVPVGRYRLRLIGAPAPAGVIEVAAAAPATTVRWLASSDLGAVPASSPTSLLIVNDTAVEQTCIVEATGAADNTLGPGSLFSLPEFRDLFSEAFLGADVALSIGQQTIMFTDIVGSTAMYAQRGDAAAFVAVRDHFRAVFAVVARHRGVVVKTIGDATMAAFIDPLDAVRCADAIQRQLGPDAPVRVRIAINTGSCIAVRLNADVDYFGNAVNLAARLQAIVVAGQVTVSATTYAAPGVAEYLTTRAPVVEVVASNGIATAIDAYRWTPE